MGNCHFIFPDVFHHARRQIVAKSFSAFQLLILGFSISLFPARFNVLGDAIANPNVGAQGLEN